MSVQVAYATIIIIWSTTPLAISWSNETLSPIAAVSIRMGAAAIIGTIILKLLHVSISWEKKAIRTYAFSLIGIYGGMFLTYMAAHYIPSWLISVIFALSPVLTNLLSYRFFGQGDFTYLRLIAFSISFSGLIIICIDDWVIHEQGWIGVILLLVAVLLFSLSGVLVQKENYQAHPLSITVGTLIMSVPFFLLSWVLLDGQLPHFDWHSMSPWAVLYLSTFGSLLGFASYFYLVRHSGATAVAMVTLMTPVIALFLGNTLNHENLSPRIMVGTGFVLLGLTIYYNNGKGDILKRFPFPKVFKKG